MSSAASFEVRRKVFYHLYKLPQVTIRRQLIIARKDLQMSPGKLAAQCCHASLAFLTDPIGMGRGSGTGDGKRGGHDPDLYRLPAPAG